MKMSQGDPFDEIEEINSPTCKMDRFLKKQENIIVQLIEKRDKIVERLIEKQDMVIKQFVEKQDKIIRLLEEIAQNKKEGGDDHSTSTSENKDPDEQLPDPEVRNRILKLQRAALNGAWENAKRIYEVHKEDPGVELDSEQRTVLHIAVAAKRIDFVKELVEIMNEEDVARRDKYGETALHYAAASGMVDLAKLIVDKSRDIASIPSNFKMLAIDIATSLGDKHMVDYLYPKTKGSLNEVDRIHLLITSIKADLYDFALQLLEDYPELATTRAPNGQTALHVLSRRHLPSPNQERAGFLKKCLGFVLSQKNVENEKLPVTQLVECIWKKVVLLSYSKIVDLITRPWHLVLEAAKEGNVEFLSILIREYPNLVWYQDENNYTIFHIAVLNRQEDIFKLIYEIGSIKDAVVLGTDNEKNNMLHLAGMMAPIDQLSIVPGAALQMRHELLWFEAVSKVVRPTSLEARNKQGLTPRALFVKNHEELRENGEKWLKETATSCMVVATLIATVAFTSAFTVPGGNKEDTGLPIFLGKVSFKTFTISDAISLVSSSTSILNFLSIFTSRHAQEDFLVASPRKLNVGLLTLFISIAAMMVMFSTTFFIAFKEGRSWMAILVAIIASTPVLVFTWQHYRLFRDVLMTTYGSNALLKPVKRNLFYKPDESLERQKDKQFSEHLTIQCPF